MVDQKIDNETGDTTHAVENALSALWEKAREASYLISTLRDDKRKLQAKIDEMEEELTHAKDELHIKQSQLDQLRNEMSNGSTGESVILAEGEKKEFQQKLRTIISKLDQYLSS